MRRGSARGCGSTGCTPWRPSRRAGGGCCRHRRSVAAALLVIEVVEHKLHEQDWFVIPRGVELRQHDAGTGDEVDEDEEGDLVLGEDDLIPPTAAPGRTAWCSDYSLPAATLTRCSAVEHQQPGRPLSRKNGRTAGASRLCRATSRQASRTNIFSCDPF